MHRDVWRFLGLSCAAALAGAAMGHVFLGLWAGALLYCYWQWRYLVRLSPWIRHRRRVEAPDAPGVFEEVCRSIDWLRNREKRRKKQLATYLKQFRQATAALRDAALVLGPDDEIQWANDAAAEHLGVRWPQDARQRITNLVREPVLYELFKRNKERRELRSLELPSPVKPEGFLSTDVMPFGEAQTLMMARDITRLYRANQIRRDFVANVSHELRTPVTVIRGYLEVLAGDHARCPESWTPVIAQLESQTQRMQRIIEDLLYLSRLEQDDGVARPEPVCVAELLSEIYQEAQTVEGGVRHLYALEMDATLCILGAQSELYGAFSNLVVNAVRYTGEGGVIRIRWYRDAEGAHLAVSDTGIGIPAHHIPRLSERFYRVDQGRSRDSGGTGLGLAIVKHVLKRHRAQLYIESMLGKGSLFRCDFPPEMIVIEEHAADLSHSA
jgi:two-component system, OmpR family, phosphate regulon sensor histidine kinase PhoR